MSRLAAVTLCAGLVAAYALALVVVSLSAGAGLSLAALLGLALTQAGWALTERGPRRLAATAAACLLAGAVFALELLGSPSRPSIATTPLLGALALVLASGLAGGSLRAAWTRAPLAQRLVTLALIVVLVPVAVLFPAYAASARADLEARAAASLLARATHLQIELDEATRSTLDAVRVEALLPRFGAFLAAPASERAAEAPKVSQIMRNLLTKDTVNLTSCALLDAHRVNVLDTDPGAVGTDERGRAWIERAFDGRGPAKSPLLLDPDGRAAFLEFVAPIRSEVTGAILGALRYRVNASLLQHVLNDNRHALEPAEAALVTRSGVVVAHADPRLRFQRVTDPEFAPGSALAPALETLAPLSYRVGDGEASLQVASVPLEQWPWMVAISEPTRVYLAPILQQSRAALLAGLLLTCLAAGLGSLFAARVAAPIHALTAAVRSLDPERPELHADETGHDEVTELARAFNAMTARLQTAMHAMEQRREDLAEAYGALEREMHQHQASQRERAELEEQLRLTQKLEAIGQLAGGVAHDFNNLLTPILAYGDLIALEQPATAPAHDYAKQIVLAAERAKTLVQQLLAFGRRQMIQVVPLDLRAELAGMREILTAGVLDSVALRLELGETPLVVEADATQFQQIVLNLVVNARDAVGGEGRITVSLSAVLIDDSGQPHPAGCAPGDYVLLQVADTGCGIPADVREHMFQPFFTTKALGKGTGLGLSTVYGIVQQHGGFLNVESQVGVGTTFNVYFPRLGAAAPASPTRRERSPQGAGEQVLVVEDDDAVRELAARLIEAHGYRVVAAADGAEAVRLLEEGAEVDAVLTDVSMPGLTGPEVYRRLERLRPGLPVVFMSGYSEDLVSDLPADAPLIPKPFGSTELLRGIRRALRADARRSSDQK